MPVFEVSLKFKECW